MTVDKLFSEVLKWAKRIAAVAFIVLIAVTGVELLGFNVPGVKVPASHSERRHSHCWHWLFPEELMTKTFIKNEERYAEWFRLCKHVYEKSPRSHLNWSLYRRLRP